MKSRKNITNVLTIAVLAMGVLASLLPSALAQTVYVDTSDAGANYQVGANWVNVRNGDGTTANLVDINNVATTFDVTLAGGLTESTGTAVVMPGAGTDANSLFDGFVDITGVWYHYTVSSATMTFTGLDPSLTYDVTIFGSRGTGALTAVEDLVLSGIDAFNNISSSGTTISTTSVANDTTKLDLRTNEDNGYVARWDSIDPGSDGEFTVTGIIADGLFFNAIRLEATAPPAATPGTLIYGK